MTTKIAIINVMFQQLRHDIHEYAKGKTWFWYVPLWLFGLYVFVKLIGFELGGQLAFVIAIPQSFNFILHEMAHLLLAFLPSIFVAAAGSFSELLLGGLLIWGAFKGRTYFASLFCALWFMLACQSTADYMADARAQALPLVSFGDVSGEGAIHDWNFIFGKLGLLESDKLIAGTVSFIGIAIGLIALIFSGWIIYKIAGAEKPETLDSQEAQLLHETAAKTLAAPAPPKHFKHLKQGALYPTPTKGRLADDDPPKK